MCFFRFSKSQHGDAWLSASLRAFDPLGQDDELAHLWCEVQIRAEMIKDCIIRETYKPIATFLTSITIALQPLVRPCSCCLQETEYGCLN
jgi:hypothetical protein